MTVADLKRMLKEAGEETDTVGADSTPPKTEPMGETGISLDAQVDKYLNEYEQEAKNAKQEGKDFRTMMKRLMREDEGTDAAAQTGGKASVNDIDLESFCNSVVRLIDNYDNLIEVRSTLVRRAGNFLAKVYDQDVTKEFSRVMRDEHGMEPGKSHQDVEDDQHPAPPAARAGEGGSGPGAPPGA